MKETTLARARLLAGKGEGAFEAAGCLVMEGGLIKALGNGVFPKSAEDMEGDYLIPGLVELHTDNLERHLMPRPQVFWPHQGAAMQAHDSQLVAAGITTVFDSVSVGEPCDKGRREMLYLALGALSQARKEGTLRAEHRLHLRCEMADPEMGEMFSKIREEISPDLVSLMDHSPGQRQWKDISAMRAYYGPDRGDFKLEDYAAQNHDKGALRRQVVSYCQGRGITMASHDDALSGHVEEALADGMAISEFPTTMEAARAARQRGLSVLMGAPNLVRGGSHSGNVSALEVAKGGCLDCLSSDYAPISLISGAWLLRDLAGFDLGQAIEAVTHRPAKISGLSDRGSLTPGLRADVVRVRLIGGRPVVRSVWVGGERVY